MPDVTIEQLTALLHCAQPSADISTIRLRPNSDEHVLYVDDFAVPHERLNALLPLLPALAGVERVIFHGEPEPTDDFYLDGRRNRHYYTVGLNRQLYAEMWTTGADGGEPWTLMRPTDVGPVESLRFDSWADIPAAIFPLLWKPKGIES